VKAAIDSLNVKLMNLEMNLLDLRLTGEGQDAVRFEAKLLQKIGYLAGGLAGADFKPTDQQVEVRAILTGQLDEQLRALETLFTRDVAALNQTLLAKGLTIIAAG
jgi:hypothetical protein